MREKLLPRNTIVRSKGSMSVKVIFKRLRRLRRLAHDMRRSGAGYRRIIVYYIKFISTKLPLALDYFRATLGSVALRRSLLARRAQAGRPMVLVTTGGGGLGDDIVIARFLRDLHAACGEVVFDIACVSPDRSHRIFSAVRGFGMAYSLFAAGATTRNYDIVLEVSQIVQVHRTASPALGRSPIAPRLAAVLAALQQFVDTYHEEIKGLPYTMALLARQAVFRNETRATGLHAQAGITYGGPRLPIAQDPAALSAFGLVAGTFVTIHNGFDPAFTIAGTRATKCYPHFRAVVRQLKSHLPELKIVQIGKETSVPIDGVDCDLLMRTTLPQVAAILGGARLHIDNESGLVHLAAALGVRSCVLCGPTDPDYFSYEGNITMRPPVCGGCWWTTESWMDSCPRGFAEPPCLHDLSPEAVAAAILAALASDAQ